MILVVDKADPLVRDARVGGELDVARESEHTLRRRADSLRVELDVPDTGSRVLRVARTVGVDEVLLARRVCTDEGGETVRVDRLVAEERDQRVGGGEDVRQQVRRIGLGAVLAADVRLDAGAERADDRGDVGAELDEVGHSDTVRFVISVP